MPSVHEVDVDGGVGQRQLVLGEQVPGDADQGFDLGGGLRHLPGRLHDPGGLVGAAAGGDGGDRALRVAGHGGQVFGEGLDGVVDLVGDGGCTGVVALDHVR